MNPNQKNRMIEPYLFFDGRCEEAIGFYTKALGAEVEMMMRFKESPEPPMNPSVPGEKIMHSSFLVAGSRVMASDGNCAGKPSFQGFSLALSTGDEGEAKRWFSALSEGGQVQAPLTKTFFSPLFGMVSDRFGVCWMVLVAKPE